MLATIFLVFPLVLIYLYLSIKNKNIKPSEEQHQANETCAYCQVSRSIH